MRRRITPSTERIVITLEETEVKKLQEGYRVYLFNARTPKKIHNTEEEALEEAIRLSKEKNRTTFVVKFIHRVDTKKFE